jgi:hypothetical protein
MTLICSCGRTVHVQGSKAAKCKCGRSFNVRIQEPHAAKRRRRARGFVKRQTGQTLRQLQGLFYGGAFVLLLVLAIALISMAGR